MNKNNGDIAFEARPAAKNRSTKPIRPEGIKVRSVVSPFDEACN